MFSDVFYMSLIAVVTVTIVVSSLAIIFGIKLERKQNEKYKAIEKLLNENKELLFEVKDSLSPLDIKKLDSAVNVENLMKKLYQTYLDFETKVKELNSNFDDILTGSLKDFYINKIKMFKKNSYMDVKEDINLVGYAITEFKKSKLKFRININCFDYKTINGEIVRGSNKFKLEQIILLSYKKIKGKWLINSYEKIYERKLGE